MAGFSRRGWVLGLCVSVLGAAFLFGTAGCKHQNGDKDKSAAGGKSLYDRLGGKGAITKVVDHMVDNAAKDPAVNFDRKNPPHPRTWDATGPNVTKLKARLVEFVSVAAGGPVEYKGADMTTAHTGMGITNQEFDALAKHLKAALDEYKVGAKEQQELLAAVEGTRGAIVGK